MASQWGGNWNLSGMRNLGGKQFAMVGCALLALQLSTTHVAFAHEQIISSGDRYQAGQAPLDNYQLGGGDKLRVIIFNEPQLSSDYVVDSAGNISMPLIGSVSVQGKTVIDVSSLIEAAYSKGDFLRNPKVAVEIAIYRPFFITGEVRTPGQFPYVSGLTVSSAIATAQGLTPRARKKVVYIRRFGEAVEQPFALTPDLRVWPGDTIRVEERLF